MKYILIDGNNLACRAAFANEALKNSDGVPTGVHYGVMQSLIGLKRRFPKDQFLIVWDGKSARRMHESEVAMNAGIIPELYKANRKKDEMPQPLKDFHEQAPYLQRGIEQTGIPQIRLNQYEADDVVASYAKKLKEWSEVVCVTSDGDYFQLLDKNVTIFDGMKGAFFSKNDWEAENGIKSNQWVDIGAMMGDSGDNIFGVPGWGEKTALKEIKKYATWKGLIEAYQAKHKSLLVKYPDYVANTSEADLAEFNKLVLNAKSEKGRDIFPDVCYMMPYARVAVAFAKEEIKIPKVELMALMFQRRIEVAYSLKKMDDEIADLPEIVQGKADREKLIEYFNYYDIETLMDAIPVFE